MVLAINAAVLLERVRDYGLVTYVSFPINLPFRCRCPLLHWWVRRYAGQLADVLERLFHAAARWRSISFKPGVKTSTVTWLVVIEAKALGWFTAWRPLASVITTDSIVLRCVFIVEYGVARFLCVMHVFEVRVSFSSPGYLCVIFFCGGLQYWASPWRKIAYSINHSITQLIWGPRNRSFRFGIEKQWWVIKVMIIITMKKRVWQTGWNWKRWLARGLRRDTKSCICNTDDILSHHKMVTHKKEKTGRQKT